MRRPAPRRGRRGRRTWWPPWSPGCRPSSAVPMPSRPELHRAAAAPRRAPGDRRGDRGHRGRRRRPAGHDRRPGPARAAEHLRRGARPQPARRPGREDVGRGRLRHRGVRGAPPLRAGAGARDPGRRDAGGSRRARCRWPNGCASARPTTARTAPGRRRRGSPGTTARSAARRPASSRCGPATGPGCSTGSPRRSRGRGSTSPPPRIETLGADAVDSFYVGNPSGSPVDAEQRERVDAALVAATRGRVRRRRSSTRRASSSVLSVARATVGGPGRNVPCRMLCERSPSWTAARGPARPVTTSPSSCSRPAPTGTPTTAASARSGSASTAAPRC